MRQIDFQSAGGHVAVNICFLRYSLEWKFLLHKEEIFGFQSA